MCGFVGPNGAGKTTAMRIVLGVLEPDAGRVRWNGAPVDTATRSRPRLVASGAVDELRERGRGGVDRVRVRVEGDGDGTLRPRHLLAGKILGLGLLGLGQLLLIAVAGLGLAAAAARRTSTAT